ncbi:hypothetical protein A2631_00140 [Candidatus Daviesbacteria bacterium RIFCSPHIGHO2_01_FULL_44_29]|uniref:DNA replication and repair protein RecF n=1 Tax=Candidatus Daviesbacteria bacterium RIFCSPHIGHO2_02_FULL_43_12 TaxID=1797776 RepID=A0A1F5KI00_9BACT|nr:MAG: hypothetical protein A2631_00140 [Candidatus Daviesbacteria bacterium RIFCSPHIGHO2_01_FULL_44_29]OGE40556.1 MAG: hypothetical protein A3D25_00355 [Candidatus Daviesbacteria bacterium RIFCSPHIGHO2_02_FULL_43_12]OGE40927.1 MAG: hypothetical protein A3E86_05565 [Candidatus Daviesbacteria bacterium RIFCSPHIGHO2_12_FULL_47_45]OGE70115.1 MAG: hypothetical protein A3B55_00125 [Candidatus Daviesbacteria bacterium RIFCSPLOWO2_01_FULL_43_15]
MFIKKLNLTHFRNYPGLDFDFSSPVTVLLGDNAEGKSSLLESIYFASTTKSPKAARDEELMTEGETVTRVEVEVEHQNQEITGLEIGMHLQDKTLTKKVKVNGVARRIVDYIGHMTVVLFAPEDINLVNGSPSLRRWHIDLTLAQIDRDYKKALTSYEDVVTRRNRVLKNIQDGLSRLDELDFWTDQLLLFGTVISGKRRELFEFINKTERKFGDFKVGYKENVLSRERLKEYQNRELAAAMSLIGPHRDDFGFFLSDRNLAQYGSRGETRTAVLDLKIAEASFIESKIGERPILLLDDVFSELDLKHREHVLDLVSFQQTIIASVELDDHLQVFFEENGKIYQVKEGGIVKSSE